MGIAHLARKQGAGGFERLVVIKRLHAHMLEEAEVLDRFLHEARLAAYVNHANVVGVQEADADVTGPYIVLDYVEGPSLDELMDRALLRHEPVPIPVLLRIALDALSGLDAIHRARRPSGEELRVLHRDVTPHNILVGRDGVARIADFGVAKSTLRTASTDKGYLVGKTLYLAPEYLRRDSIGPAVDVYGLGVSLWVTLAGDEPWPELDDAQLLSRVVGTGLPPIAATVDVPPQVAEIIDRACSVDLDRRYGTAAEMAEAIECLGRETSWIASHNEVASFVERLAGADLDRRRKLVAASRPGAAAPASLEQAPTMVQSRSRSERGTVSGTVPVALTQPARRSRALPVLLALVVVVGATTLGFAYLRPSSSPPEPERVEPASPPPERPAPATIPSPPRPPDNETAPSHPLPSPEPEPVPVPAAVPHTTRGVAPPRLSAPEVTAPTSSAPRAVEEMPAPKPAPPSPPPPRAPSEITKKNPYR
jgi:serine/threonine-protein kinase